MLSGELSSGTSWLLPIPNGAGVEGLGWGQGCRPFSLPQLPGILHHAREESNVEFLIWDLMGTCSALEIYFLRPQGDFIPISSGEAMRESK